MKRIIAKAVLSIIGLDIHHAAGPLQLCAGHMSGVEAAIHAVRTVYTDDSSEGLLLVDASNSFNSLNCAVALNSIQYLCPFFSTILISTYRSLTALSMNDDVLYSNEGTTQGHPLAMPFYALAIIPLIQRLSKSVTQAWYVDDTSVCCCEGAVL